MTNTKYSPGWPPKFSKQFKNVQKLSRTHKPVLQKILEKIPSQYCDQIQCEKVNNTKTVINMTNFYE